MKNHQLGIHWDGHTPTPEVAYTTHTFGRHVEKPRVRVVELPSNENPTRIQATGDLEADAARVRGLYTTPAQPSFGVHGPAVHVVPNHKVVDNTPRVSDKGKPNDKLMCPQCEWWCTVRNSHKLETHTSNKHGGA